MAIAVEKDLAALREQLQGQVVTAEEADWNAARQAYNLAVDQKPDMVALPRSAEDVTEVVRFARERGLKVAAQRTGHNADPLGPLDGIVLLNTKLMNGVDIDADGRSARVEGGAQWHDVIPRASELGLAALHGSAPDVGIAGYMLGGGVGFYGRKLGLAANTITAIELVNADGEPVRATPEDEPELFWALRGGGGNFGIVTALEFELFPLEQVYAGVLFFPFERSTEVLRAWNEWLPSTPDEATTVGRMMQFPPLPELPDELRGKSFALVEMVFMGSESDGAQLLAPLRDLGPAIDTFAMVPPEGISVLHMDPPDPLPYEGDHLLLGDLPAKGIEEFVEAGGPGSGSSLISAELRQLGGAMGRRHPGGGALDRIDASFLYFGVGIKDGPESGEATEASLAKLNAAVTPYDAGCRYLNFVEQAGDPSVCWDAEAYERLQRARASYDPDGIFRANHVIAPTA
jgi:FAD/FMN-containing dehydrogenase